MNKNFIGNEYAYNCLVNYLRFETPGPLILLGKKGLGKLIAAKDVASKLLACQTDDLQNNLDFFLLDKKQENIKVEDVLNLLDRSSMSAISKRKIFIIRNSEKINIQAQNKLLKLLEDKNKTNLVILLCNQDTLLETVKSRCFIVTFSQHNQKEMEKYLIEKDINKNDISLMTYICDFCPYNLTEVTPYFLNLKETFLKLLNISNKKTIFQVLHLIQEKDSENFYVLHMDHFFQALQMFQYLFFELLLHKQGLIEKNNYANINNLFTLKQTYRACLIIVSHQKLLQSGYSKNDFFELICSIIQE